MPVYYGVCVWKRGLSEIRVTVVVPPDKSWLRLYIHSASGQRYVSELFASPTIPRTGQTGGDRYRVSFPNPYDFLGHAVQCTVTFSLGADTIDIHMALLETTTFHLAPISPRHPSLPRAIDTMGPPMPNERMRELDERMRAPRRHYLVPLVVAAIVCGIAGATSMILLAAVLVATSAR